MIIQWKNKWSGETGFVAKINRKKGYFENTFNEAEALKVNPKTIGKTLAELKQFCDDNEYTAIER